MAGDFDNFLQFIKYMHKESSKSALAKGRKPMTYEKYVNSRFSFLLEQFKEATRLLH